MHIERWYSSLVCFGISLLAHLGLVVVTTGFRPAAPPLDVAEIEVGLAPDRPVHSESHGQPGLRRAGPKLVRPQSRAVSTATSDPFAPTGANTQPREVRALATNRSGQDMRRQLQPNTGPEADGVSSYTSAGSGGGDAPASGAPRTRLMGVTAMEAPVRRMTFLTMERPGFAAAPQTDLSARADDFPSGRIGTSGVVPGAALPGSGGQAGSVRVEAVAARQGSTAGGSDSGPAEGAKSARRQESFVPAKPKYRANPLTGFPDAARSQRQHGIVTLRVKVSAAGRAESVELETSSGYPLLDDAALAVVRGWGFEPARNMSGPLASVLILPVRVSVH